MAVVEIAVDAIVLSFCLDCERNNGTPSNAPPLLLEAMSISQNVTKEKLQRQKEMLDNKLTSIHQVQSGSVAATSV